MFSDGSSLAQAPQKNFVVISPYLVDPRTAKKVNVGDGFIMDSALKLMGARPIKVLSSRLPISAEDLDVINSSKLVLVAGANTLKSVFEITPNFTPGLLDQIRPPIALCGIGHYGTPQATAAPLDENSSAIMREILRRFPYVSVRCDASAAYLRASLPALADQVLMTSCPVVYPVDGIDHGFAKRPVLDHLVVTITDRGDLRSQAALIKAGSVLFQSTRKTLALHQDYNHEDLYEFARGLGYEVFRSQSYQDFLDLYATADMHFGNRLHGHLKCVSYGVRSFLTPFDLRQQFFAESLDFPLITKLPTDLFDTYDFGRIAARLAPARPRMELFMAAVNAALDH